MLPYVNQGLMDCARKQMSDDHSPATASPIRTDAAPAAYIRCNIVGLHCRHYYTPFVCGQWNPKNPGRPASIIAFSITPGPWTTD